jgi:hypothetical protein
MKVKMNTNQEEMEAKIEASSQEKIEAKIEGNQEKWNPRWTLP